MQNTYTFDDLNSRYEEFTSAIRCDCILSTEMVGGQPAGEDGVRQYVIHHLKILDPDEQEKAVQRILKEEIEDTKPEDGELEEGRLYGLRSLRRNSFGPYIGDWQIKACLKQAATNLNLFVQVRGTKRSFAEAGRVRAWKYSLQDVQHPNLVYLRNFEATDKPNTYHKDFMGRVHSPQGDVSIIHRSECVEERSRFAFEFRFPKGNLKEEDVKDVLVMSMLMGIGSARSLERGKFRIETAEIELHEDARRKQNRAA